jgi:hypothetical protein
MLYFQQLQPLSKCVADDGRVVGHLLMDLIESKPKDLTHAMRTFSNRMAMLRECGFRIGAFLVALLYSEHAAATPEKNNVLATGSQDPVAVTEEQAAAIGRTLAAAMLPSATSVAVHEAVNLHAVLRTMKSKYAWFVPMLETLLVQGADRRRSTISRRLSSVVTPASLDPEATEAIAGDSLIHAATKTTEGANDGSFDSIVRLPAFSVYRYPPSLDTGGDRIQSCV